MLTIHVPERPTPLHNEWGFLREGGEADIRLLNDGRKLLTLQELLYIDFHDVEHFVPEFTIADGASIPWWLWSVTGSPLVGLYRVPSIFHDYQCVQKHLTLHSGHCHTMFYNAMRCAGVSPFKAWKMFEAVNNFGPSWDNRSPAEQAKAREGDIEW